MSNHVNPLLKYIKLELVMALDGEEGGTMEWVDSDLGIAMVQFTPKVKGGYLLCRRSYFFKDQKFDDKMKFIAAIEADGETVLKLQVRAAEEGGNS